MACLFFYLRVDALHLNVVGVIALNGDANPTSPRNESCCCIDGSIGPFGPAWVQSSASASYIDSVSMLP